MDAAGHFAFVFGCFLTPGTDLMKEYQGCSVALDLPKSHSLRAQLNHLKVQIQELREFVKDRRSWEKMSDKDYNAKNKEIRTKVGS